jgi:hypothetical protein
MKTSSRSKADDPVGKALEQTAAPLQLDAAALQRQVDSVLSEDLYWFPVRHHSPMTARFVDLAIRERKPKIVFLEGPAEANHLVKHLVDAKTKPPVAIYSSYRDDANMLGLAGVASPALDIPARFSCWYPLLAYSPEYAAMLAAKKSGAEVVFIDLPFHASIKPAEPRTPDDSPAGLGGREQPATIRDDERLLAESGFYHELARVAGYRSWDEAWDSLFEMRSFEGVEAFRREMATFCAAARATTPAERIQSDDTLPRERHMRALIANTLKARKLAPKQCLVVCGGFHLFLDRQDTTEPPAPPEGTVYTTVVPYSFFRMSQLSGYAAGNRAPQFYQRVWELRDGEQTDEYLIQHTIAVLKQIRKAREPASTADAIAVCQHANLLARLRGRPCPVLDDIHDALVTCIAKGNPSEEGRYLLEAIDQADIGTAIGKVTAAVGRLPIVEDFYHCLDEYQLQVIFEKEKRVRLDLDKRVELANRQSTFLHRLRYLGVELAVLVEAPTSDFSTGKIFREKWDLRWSPNIEAQLVEQNLYGDRIETAALARLREDIAKDELHAGHACQRLAAAIDMDLPNLILEAEQCCGRAIDTDTRLVSLSEALGHLCVLDRYAVFRQLSRTRLEDLLVRCYDRACFAVPEAAAAPEDQQMAVVQALLSLAEVAGRDLGFTLDRQLFVQHVRQAAAASPVPFLRGAFLGMLAELRDLPAEELAGEVASLAKAPVEIMVTAGDFLDGVLAVSRTSILVGAEALIAAVDELLRAAAWDPFLVMLPRLRAAFERLHRHQRDAVAVKVAERYGLAKAEQLTALTLSVAAAARVARIDQQVAQILAKWDL